MKPNFKCPKCKSKQAMGKHLHSVWTCPSCHYSLVPSKEMARTGHAPYRKNFMDAGRPPRKPFNRNKVIQNAR